MKKKSLECSVLKASTCGFYDGDIFKKPLDVTNCHSAIHSLKSVFDSNDIWFLLLHGTCLGAYRDGQVMAYDTDVDFGLYWEDIESFLTIIPELESLGLRIYSVCRYGKAIKCIYKDTVFVFWMIFSVPFCQRLWGYKWECDLAIFRDDYFNRSELGEISFLRESYMIPANVEGYLKELYGHNWKKPIMDQHAVYRPLLSRLLNRLCCRRKGNTPSKFSGNEW